MTNRPKEWLHSFWYTDQFNTVIRTSITLGFILILLVPGLAMLAIVVAACADFQPSTAEECFQDVVGISPRRVTNIQHYHDGGIDFVNYFRFEYSHDDDIDAILQTLGMTLTQFARPLDESRTPDWYVVPSSAIAYSADQSPDFYTLFVDTDKKVAYFQQVHI